MIVVCLSSFLGGLALAYAVGAGSLAAGAVACAAYFVAGVFAVLSAPSVLRF